MLCPFLLYCKQIAFAEYKDLRNTLNGWYLLRTVIKPSVLYLLLNDLFLSKNRTKNSNVSVQLFPSTVIGRGSNKVSTEL